MAKTKSAKSKEKLVNDITIKETEEDLVLSAKVPEGGDDLKNQIKKEADKSAVISRFLIPFFTFIIIASAAAAATWYYAKPEREPKPSVEEKIKTPPKVDNTTQTPAPSTPATITPAPAAQPQYESYTVKEGDTLSLIANAYGLTSKQVADYNGLTNADDLHIGQTLKIPK